MVLLDGRPPALNAQIRSGNSFAATLTWPTGTLTGRTWTATLDAASLSVSVASDVMTIVASEAQTAAAASVAVFTLTETTGGISQDILAGTWVVSTRPSAAVSLDATVTLSGGAVTVSGATDPSAVRVTGDQTVAGDKTFTGDMTINGEILTGTFAEAPTFGGIQREARFFPAGAGMSPTGVINFGDGVPRINMPDGVQTDVYWIFEIEEWWLVHTLGIYYEYVNDHSASGDVRWEYEIKEVDIATESPATADSPVSYAETVTTQGAGLSDTNIITSIGKGSWTPDPGTFASFYCLRISRLGTHVDDTLAGPVGLVASNMTRGQ